MTDKITVGSFILSDVRSGRNILSRYNSLFSIYEIEMDIVLKFFSGAILLGYFTTFESWMYSSNSTLRAVENKTYICWPFFQNCDQFIWLKTLPDGYSQTTLFMIIFGLMIFSIFLMIKSRWEMVHLIIMIITIFKLYFMIIDYSHKGNYDYYLNSFSFIFLFARNKKFFLQIVLVLFYFLSTASKIHPSWLLGEYFTSLQTGLPIFPAGTEIIMTNFVIIMEMIASWFLFSKNIFLQRSVLVFFIVFHLYSGILVGYRYPATVLPALIILFGHRFQPWKSIPAGRSSIVGWCFMGCLVLAQMVPYMIEGDQRLTLEGNHFGLYMFEANHQCFGVIRKGDKVVQSISSANARNRCDPYDVWFRAKNQFCDSSKEPVRMQFNHSINGNPFREIVNEPDICGLIYHPFSRNYWIKDETEAKSVGIPVKSIYR